MSDLKEATAFSALLGLAQGYTPTGKKKFPAQARTEEDQAFFARLLGHIAEVPQEQFDAIPVPAQEWFNNSGEAFNAQQPVTAPEGFESNFKPKATKAGPAPKEALAADAGGRGRKRADNTAGRTIRRALIENQAITLDDLKGLLNAAGFTEVKEATIGSYRADTLETLRVAAEMQKFTPNPPVAA